MTPNEALQECIKLDPNYSYICTHSAQHCLHGDGSTSTVEDYRICRLPLKVEPELFWGKSFEEALNQLKP